MPLPYQLEWINQGTNLNFGEARVTQPRRHYGWSAVEPLCLHQPGRGGLESIPLPGWRAKLGIAGACLPPPWEVGLYVSPSDPDALFMGEVECYRSLNAGQHWDKANNWWDYYEDMRAACMRIYGYCRV